MIVDVADLKTALGITGTSQDALLQGILFSAEGIARRIIGRNIEEETYTNEEYDGHWEHILSLKNYPVSSVASVEYRDGDSWTPTTDEYRVRKETGEIRFVCSHVPRGFENVRVTYTAGYNPIPKDIIQAIIDIASTIYNTRNSAGIKREKVDGSEIEFSGNGPVAPATEAILSSYRSLYV